MGEVLESSIVLMNRLISLCGPDIKNTRYLAMHFPFMELS